MNTKQMLAAALLLAVSVPTVNGAYDEIECSVDAVFSANSCDQCFDWGQKSVEDGIQFIDDLWINRGNIQRIMYKEEQTWPRMLSLGGSNWSQSPSADGFWEYTDSLEALYSESDQWYILEPGAQVKFIQSKLGTAYVLDWTDAAQGANAGLLIFPLISHTLSSDGDISTDDTVHNECVLFKAGGQPKVEVTPPGETPKPTPKPTDMAQVETGAEAYLILLFALILGFVYIKTRRHA